MYQAAADPYCYAGTGILKNRAGIRDQATLDEFETAMTTARADEPLPNGKLSLSHYRAIHRHLFQDVYSWAGRFRTVRIGKDDSTFCFPEHIPREMTRLFADLKRQNHLRGLAVGPFAARAAHFLATLNAIHPFREGNGRSQMALLALIAEGADHPLDLGKLVPERFLAAMVASFQGNERPLARELIEMPG